MNLKKYEIPINEHENAIENWCDLYGDTSVINICESMGITSPEMIYQTMALSEYIAAEMFVSNNLYDLFLDSVLETALPTSQFRSADAITTQMKEAADHLKSAVKEGDEAGKADALAEMNHLADDIEKYERAEKEAAKKKKIKKIALTCSGIIAGVAAIVGAVFLSKNLNLFNKKKSDEIAATPTSSPNDESASNSKGLGGFLKKSINSLSTFLKSKKDNKPSSGTNVNIGSNNVGKNNSVNVNAKVSTVVSKSVNQTPASSNQNPPKPSSPTQNSAPKPTSSQSSTPKPQPAPQTTSNSSAPTQKVVAPSSTQSSNSKTTKTMTFEIYNAKTKQNQTITKEVSANLSDADITKIVTAAVTAMKKKFGAETRITSNVRIK